MGTRQTSTGAASIIPSPALGPPAGKVAPEKNVRLLTVPDKVRYVGKPVREKSVVPTNKVHSEPGVGERRIEFDWDEANVGHIARHQVQPVEAEQVILNNPLDLGMEIIEGEERFVNLGATSLGRILLVVTTWREDRIRVVTAFAPIKRLVQFYYQEQGR